MKNCKYLVETFNVDPLYLKHKEQGNVPDYRVLNIKDKNNQSYGPNFNLPTALANPTWKKISIFKDMVCPQIIGIRFSSRLYSNCKEFSLIEKEEDYFYY